MALTPMPYLSIQEFDSNGDPIVGGKLFFYASGTSTKQNTYTDATGATANANPVILDAAGRATVFFSPSTYKVVLAPASDADPPVSPIWTRDGVSAVPATNSDLDIEGVAGEALTINTVAYLSDGSSGRTAGRWYQGDAYAPFSSTAAPMVGMVPAAIASGSTGSTRLSGRITGLSGLTAGATYYLAASGSGGGGDGRGLITATPPVNARAIGTADSTTSLILVAQTPSGVGTFVSNYLLFDATKNNNTTFADVLGMSFQVAANASYWFQFYIHGISATAADWKFTLTGPASPTAVRYGAALGGGSISDVSAFGSSVIQAGSGFAELLSVGGTLRNGANAGTVQLQFAQNSADVSDTIIRAESSVLAFRIA